MKKLITTLLISALFISTVFCIPANATITLENTQTTIELLENGDYIETVISCVTDKKGFDYSTYATQTKTGKKTSSYKNSSGTVLWSVSVTGTFSYNGSTATCTSKSHSATSYSSSWSIKSVSSTKSGNSATANAVATHRGATGTTDYSMSVTLRCSANGTLS